MGVQQGHALLHTLCRVELCVELHAGKDGGNVFERLGYPGREFLMVENLLHEDMVLSQKQYECLREAGLTGFLASVNSDKIGTLTFLGADEVP